MSINKTVEEKFTAIDLLNVICDGLVKYRVYGTLPKMSVRLELPPPTFEKFMSDMKCVSQNADITSIKYGNFNFTVIKTD